MALLVRSNPSWAQSRQSLAFYFIIRFATIHSLFPPSFARIGFIVTPRIRS